MSKPDTWMPLVIGDYFADTGHLSTVEHGAYLLLLMTAWMRDGDLPDDDAQLARITRASAREWKTLRAALAPFFHVANGVWRQKRLLRELAAAKAKAAAAGAKASNANAARWGKERIDKNASSNAPSNTENDALSIARSNAPSNAQEGSQAMPRVGARKPLPLRSLDSKSLLSKKKVETRIPEDFGISERVRAWGERKGYENLVPYLEIFVGRNSAKSTTYLDWDQAFMNAVREDWYEIRAPKNGGNREPTLAEKRAQKFDKIKGNGKRERTIEGVAERVDSPPLFPLSGDLRKPGDDDVGRR